MSVFKSFLLSILHDGKKKGFLKKLLNREDTSIYVNIRDRQIKRFR